MGIIAPKKQPKTIVKRDGNEPLQVFKRGGKVKHKGRKDMEWRPAPQTRQTST